MTKIYNNVLNKEMQKMHEELEVQRKMREDQLVDLNFDRILSAIVSKSEEIAIIMELTKGKGLKKVMRTVESEIVRAAEETLWCPDYYPRTDRQDVFCYTGTHWIAVEPSVWKYFIRQCAERCGLPQDMLEDADFMVKLGNHTAYNIFKVLKSSIPDDEVWLNMPNNTLVIKSDGSITTHEHRPEDLFYYCLPYNYDHAASCPEWLKFLNRVLPELAAQKVLAEFICYILMKSHRYEVMLWLYGPGQNGKSTVLRVLEELLGAFNVSFISLYHLTTDQKIRLGIEHKKLNISSESGRDVDPDELKKLVSGEKVTVERKYHDARQTDDYGKLIVATNHLPKAEDTRAFYRRMIIMPFEVIIPDHEKDTKLFEKLKAELPGILRWALDAFPGLIERDGFTESELCRKALKKYMAQADGVRLFVDQMCEDSTTTTRGADLYYAYQNFCKFMQTDKKEGRNDFYKRLADIGYKPVPNGNNAKLFNLRLSE